MSEFASRMHRTFFLDSQRKESYKGNTTVEGRINRAVNFCRFLAERWSTPIWWRSARISAPRAAWVRNTEDSAARNAERTLSIGSRDGETKSIFHHRRRIDVYEKHRQNLEGETAVKQNYHVLDRNAKEAEHNSSKDDRRFAVLG